jgi:acyl-homoserine lactone acylase PvdQ
MARRAVAMTGVVVVALVLALSPLGATTPRDYAAQAWTILPPGENGSVSFDRNTRDQAKLYDALTPLRGAVTQKTIERLFKPAPLGIGNAKPVRVERPRAGVTISRDRFGVAHVDGKKDTDVAFGAGWVTAADRGLLLALIRGPARAAAIDAPGLDPVALALSGKTFVPSAQTEEFLNRQLALLQQQKPYGPALVRILNAYVAGINAWNRAHDVSGEPYTANDAVASAALLAARFGTDGGREVANAMFFDALRKRLGDAKARAVFTDLREANDPEAPVTVPGSFPQAVTSSTSDGSVMIDDGSFRGAQAPARESASNALLVAGRRSATGKPLFVAGPQVGYFFPGFLAEIDLEGGGWATRGALFPGAPLVLVGRGPDYAWSASSSHGDSVDLFVETLCGDDRHYSFNGVCREMTRFDAGVLRAAGKPDEPVSFLETVHGPVVGYATAAGRRVALSARRSTRGRELLSMAPFFKLDTARVTSARSFVQTMAGVEFSFNWFYADDRDIAFFSSGRLPVRAPGTDPGLPTEGSGGHEWSGFVAPAGHAQAINPPSGVIVNWNQKPAADIGAADSNFGYGPVQRVTLLATKLARIKKHTLATVTAAMNESATQDLRAVKVWPTIRGVLAGGPAPSTRASAAVALVDAWLSAGSSRIDADLDGKVDAPGAAVLDAAWPRLADAVLSPVLGPLTDRLDALMARDDSANSGGSSYDRGWYGYVDKDLRTLIGLPVRGPYNLRYCGGGDVTTCRTALWAAIDVAAGELEKTQGPTPASWRADATSERIRFVSGVLPDTMRWTNRPTFQQLMSFSGHRPR